MFSGKSGLRMVLRMILFEMIMISGKYESAVFLQIDLHHAQSGRMPWAVVHRDALP